MALTPTIRPASTLTSMAMTLTELGHSPGQIDYSYFCWRAREQ